MIPKAMIVVSDGSPDIGDFETAIGQLRKVNPPLFLNLVRHFYRRAAN